MTEAQIRTLVNVRETLLTARARALSPGYYPDTMMVRIEESIRLQVAVSTTARKAAKSVESDRSCADLVQLLRRIAADFAIVREMEPKELELAFSLVLPPAPPALPVEEVDLHAKEVPIHE